MVFPSGLLEDVDDWLLEVSGFCAWLSAQQQVEKTMKYFPGSTWRAFPLSLEIESLMFHLGMCPEAQDRVALDMFRESFAVCV